MGFRGFRCCLTRFPRFAFYIHIDTYQSSTFGPFDRQVLIMNTDGKTYTLLENPVAMRLKRAGFINDKRAFITQPTPEDLEQAEQSGGGGFLGGIFGGN